MKNTAVRARLLGSQDADGALVFFMLSPGCGGPSWAAQECWTNGGCFWRYQLYIYIYIYIYTHVAISVCWFYFLLDAWNPQRSGFHQKLKVQEEAIPGNQKQCAVWTCCKSLAVLLTMGVRLGEFLPLDKNIITYQNSPLGLWSDTRETHSTTSIMTWDRGIWPSWFCCFLFFSRTREWIFPKT